MDRPLDQFQLWSSHPYFDEANRAELHAIAANTQAIEERFGNSLEFGTAGLRGIIGAGTNRINRYMVRQATQGLARYMLTQGPEAQRAGVVIAHDSRHYSWEFAREAALTLNANGIVAYRWDDLRPAPMLSFAVRELGAMAGIVITASHNPPEYNGYKVYWSDGGQVPPHRAGLIQAEIRQVEDLTQVAIMEETEARAAGLLRAVSAQVDRRYLDRLLELAGAGQPGRTGCKVLYTPLHGSGYVPVVQVLTELGHQVSTVAAQAQPDGDFPTVRTPNPEERSVFELALAQAQVECPDVIMATDPDADRLGVMVRKASGEYTLLTGNQLGAILVDYILSRHKEGGTLPANGAVIKTIATSNLVAPLCAAYGVTLMDTHTGFKFIGDKIYEFEQTGSHTFLFGFEESYGYLGATFVRDKDAVMAAMLVAEAAAYHKSAGRTVYDVLEAIWRRCGYFAEGLHNVTLPGQDGQRRIADLMADLRRDPPRELGGAGVAFLDDHASGIGRELSSGREYELALERANVLHYRFADGGFVMVRPSGTEPKLKLYVSAVGEGRVDAEQKAQRLMSAMRQRLGI